MLVKELEDQIKKHHLQRSLDEVTLKKVTDELEILKAKVSELVDSRRELKDSLYQHDVELKALANKKERALQEEMLNRAISDTAERVAEILGDFEGWNLAHGYQKADIISAVHAYLTGFTGFMNANDMGLGKTMEAFITLKVYEHLFQAEFNRAPKILWLTKTSILNTGGTVREANRWYPDFPIVPVKGSAPKQERNLRFQLAVDLDAAVITNYEAVRTTEILQETSWDIIVMDEVHKLKGGANNSGPTAVWKAVKSITENARMVLMLTGTPMVNKPSEMWAYLNIFDPERFPSVHAFENLFCTYKGLDLQVDADKLLDNALKGRMIRRAKTDEDVKLDLPEITPYEERARLVEMEGQQLAAYEQMRDRFFIWLDEQNPDEMFTATAIIAQLTRLRQISVWPVIHFQHPKDPTKNITLDIHESSKIDELMDIIDEAQDQVVVFGTFNEPFKEIQRRCNLEGLTCALLTGENSKNMDTMEYDFQQGKINVLCVNSAMGEGLNLQKNPTQWPGGSSYVVFLDLWWNSARNDQCTDRCYRQGASEPVTVYHLENENSVDQYINSIIADKDKEIKGVTESTKLRPSDWKQMLKGKI